MHALRRSVLLAFLFAALLDGCGAPSEQLEPVDPALCSVPTAQEIYPGDMAPKLVGDVLAADWA